MNKSVASLHRRVLTAMEQGSLTGEALVVAVSGGPDSLAMLYALHHLRDEAGLRLHGAHLDHRLRGDASRGDSQFVAKTFRRLDIPFTLEEADVRSFQQKHKLSLEEAAREVRYTFLSRVASEQNADAIAVGHTSDDQAETVIMNIIRGCGLSGLRGMEVTARRTFDGNEVVLVRPLLRASRQETADYCREMELKPRQDESNLSYDIRRNRVRLELLPQLEKYNPAIRDALVRLSRSAAQDVAFIEEHVETVWNKMEHLEDGGVALDRDTFLNLAPSVQNHLLRRVVLEVKGDLEDVEQNHVESMARLMSGAAGKSLDLPDNMRLSVGYETATLAPAGEKSCPLQPFEGEHSLQTPGETSVSNWRVLARFSERRGCDSEAPEINDYTAYFDYHSLGGQLRVRPRIPGDRFQPLGMSRPKKLQDFMVDSKIPRQWRGRVPLVVSPRGIAWVVGWRISEWAKICDSTTKRLEVRFLPG